MATTTTATASTNKNNYVENHLPPAVIRKLESGAFQSLCTHLQERSDEVQNIDLMTVSGFCRNCLSKWLVVEARKLSDSIQNDNNNTSDEHLVQALDAMGYDEAAQYVYGMTYPDWKKRHAQKASEEQLEKFNGSKPLWAAHDKQVLAKRRDDVPDSDANAPVCTIQNNSNNNSKNHSAGITTKPSLLSNVCCEDSETIDTMGKAPKTLQTQQQQQQQQQQHHAPSTGANHGGAETLSLPALSFSLGILTVSDRAASGKYDTGDLSGSAVRDSVESVIANANAKHNSNTALERIATSIVPDDADAIKQRLLEWTTASSSPVFDLVITTGGTGFSPRDVTPEATASVLERSCDGLMTVCGLQTRGEQPLAALSRGTAGVRGRTLIANLPGNPYAVRELVPVLLPLALHAVADMKA